MRNVIKYLYAIMGAGTEREHENVYARPPGDCEWAGQLPVPRVRGAAGQQGDDGLPSRPQIFPGEGPTSTSKQTIQMS